MNVWFWLGSVHFVLKLRDHSYFTLTQSFSFLSSCTDEFQEYSNHANRFRVTLTDILRKEQNK